MSGSVAWLFALMVGAGSHGVTSAARSRELELRAFVRPWLGTTYRFGGDSRSGIDCSAFVRRIYREVFRVALPRNTARQVVLGVPLALDLERLDQGLRPGDLLFYVDADGIPRHVVVYLGHGEIAHSRSVQGVVIESVETIRGRYIAARRLIAP